MGPILLSLFISDLPLHVKNISVDCDMLADDTTLHTSGKYIIQIRSNMQDSLDQVSNWCDNNHTVINPIKTKSIMSFKSFKEKFGIKTDYITYTGCVQVIKNYIRKTEITVEGKHSADLIKMLKTIYNQQKGSRLYYKVLMQNVTRPNCCDKWEAKLNKDINWCITFKKMQQIQEIKLKWFQIRLVHRIIATNVVLMHMGIENGITLLFLSTRPRLN